MEVVNLGDNRASVIRHSTGWSWTIAKLPYESGYTNCQAYHQAPERTLQGQWWTQICSDIHVKSLRILQPKCELNDGWSHKVASRQGVESEIVDSWRKAPAGTRWHPLEKYIWRCTNRFRKWLIASRMVCTRDNTVIQELLTCSLILFQEIART